MKFFIFFIFTISYLLLEVHCKRYCTCNPSDICPDPNFIYLSVNESNGDPELMELKIICGKEDNTAKPVVEVRLRKFLSVKGMNSLRLQLMDIERMICTLDTKTDYTCEHGELHFVENSLHEYPSRDAYLTKTNY